MGKRTQREGNESSIEEQRRVTIDKMMERERDRQEITWRETSLLPVMHPPSSR